LAVASGDEKPNDHEEMTKGAR